MLYGCARLVYSIRNNSYTKNNNNQIIFESLIDKVLPITLTPEDLGITRENSQPYEEIINTFGHIHHIDGNRDNNNLENLTLICPSCHGKTHFEMSKSID
jgi:5-methylcytosine-specific restriction endonuclease McrA